MTQEEKAKAYDEVREKIALRFGSNVAEEIFSKFEESEDEKIRKGIIKFLIDVNNGAYTKSELEIASWIAWLEKQGEEKPLQEDEYERMIKALKEGFKYHQLFNPTFGGIPCTEIVNWLEKQGEQEKPQVYKTDDGEVITYSESEGYKVIEPKFKVGDWILYSGDHYEGVRHITKINENGYYIERNGLPHGIIPFNHEICMRLWTIQNAKDGDVLSDGTTIFKFKDLLSDGSVMSYCDYDTDSGESDAFCPLSVNLMCSKITPTTKEQRDILFQKMKEARYMWDSEKKELKNIEQNSAWSEEDNKWIESLIQTFEDGYLDWLKSLRERYTWKLSDEQTDELENEYLKSIPKY